MNGYKVVVPTTFAYGTWNNIGYLGTVLSRYSNRGEEIHKDLMYIDKEGENTKLELLLNTVERGDKIVIGTIADLKKTTIPDLLDLLRMLYNKGVEIISGNEPTCGIKQFMEMLYAFENLY